MGLAAYRALSWRSAPQAVDISETRPIGQVLWCHATSSDRLNALRNLCQKVEAARPDLSFLITCAADVEPDNGAHPKAVCLDTDHPASVRVFLDHWQPDVCVWTGANWMPNLISAAADRGVVMILADLGARDLAQRRRWLPDLTRACIDRFETILLREAAAVDPMRRLGIPARRFSVHSPLRADANLSPCADEDLSAITSELSGRPLWLASQVDAGEFAGVLAAHREALGLLHRLLLVIVPSESDTCSRLAAELDQSGLRFDGWMPGDPVPEHKQVLITDHTQLDLWYRLAPLTFMGGSLVPGTGGRDPVPASALGSAVLYGPHVARYADTYRRLDVDGAARTVRTRSGLAACVAELVSPDKAARMALAGWQVVTEGAALNDLLVDRVQDQLDQCEVRNASA